MKWILLGLLNLLMISEVLAANTPKFKLDFCGCKDGLAVMYSGAGCNNFCQETQTNGAEVLFANFSMKNRRFQSVQKWCNSRRILTQANPRCFLQATDESGNESLLDVSFVSKNSIKVNIDSLATDRTYVLRLIEASTNKQSDAIQILKY